MTSFALIEFAWPSPDLNQNNTAKWPKINAAREARAMAKGLAAHVSPDPRARLVFSFFPPDRRRRDIQNMPGIMKPYIDGIADAMGVDDNGFRPQFPDRFGDAEGPGFVLVEIYSGEEFPD